MKILYIHRINISVAEDKQDIVASVADKLDIVAARNIVAALDMVALDSFVLVAHKLLKNFKFSKILKKMF